MPCLDADTDHDSLSSKILIESLSGGIAVYNTIRNAEAQAQTVFYESTSEYAALQSKATFIHQAAINLHLQSPLDTLAFTY